MPKFRVTYNVVITEERTFVVSAKDEDAAEEKAQARLEKVDAASSRWPGEEENTDSEFEITDVTEE